MAPAAAKPAAKQPAAAATQPPAAPIVLPMLKLKLIRAVALWLTVPELGRLSAAHPRLNDAVRDSPAVWGPHIISQWPAYKPIVKRMKETAKEKGLGNIDRSTLMHPKTFLMKRLAFDPEEGAGQQGGGAQQEDSVETLRARFAEGFLEYQVKDARTNKVVAAKLIPLTDTLAMLQLVNLQGEGVPLPLLPRANGHGRVGEVPEDLGHWQIQIFIHDKPPGADDDTARRVISLVFVKSVDVDVEDKAEGIYHVSTEDYSGGWHLPPPFCEEAHIAYLPSLRVTELPDALDAEGQAASHAPVGLRAWLEVSGYEGSEVLRADKEAADFLQLLRYRLDGIPLR